MSRIKIGEIEELGYEDSTNIVLHELGNMIMLMDCSLKKIEKTYKEIENDENFRYLKEDTKQIIGLITGAKEKNGIYQLYREETQIVDMLESIVGKYRERCELEKINLTLIEDLGSSVSIYIDRFKFSRVVENIIINAIEELEMCSEKLTKNITIKIYRDKLKNKDDVLNEKTEIGHNENYFIISINNTGRVIEKEILKNIFNPYFTNKDNGTGIGLSFCEKIVKLHNGKIKVVSNKKSGTTFIIKIPIK